MRKLITGSLGFVLLLYFPVVLVAQEQTKDLNFKSGMWDHNYYINNQQATFDVFINELNVNNMVAGNLFKSARNLSVTGNFIAVIGSFFVGYDLGSRFGGGKGNMALLFGGGGVMISGAFMHSVGEKKMREALTLYRDNFTTLYVSPTQTGVGLCFDF